MPDEIKPDTSLYASPVNRAAALNLVLQAPVDQIRCRINRTSGEWRSTMTDADRLKLVLSGEFDYRANSGDAS